MRRKLAFIFITITLFPLSLFCQEVQFTKRSKNEVREGPGNYYPLLFVLPAGLPLKILEKQDGWFYSRLSEQYFSKCSLSGWVAKNCFSSKSPRRAPIDMELDVTSPYVSPTSIAAAIRGFAQRYGKTKPEAIDSLLFYQNFSFTPQDYFLFKKDMPKAKDARISRMLKKKYAAYFQEYDVTIDEEGVGLGVAARVSADSLINNPHLLKYINLVAAVISEVSGAYDVPFRVYILNKPVINAVAIPGGFIFITMPLLNLCRDEAELAAVIAHEMMHIIMKHGVKEIHERIMNIKMDKVMQELEEETGEVPSTIEQDLEELAAEAYDNVVKPRLQHYEEQADQGAALLLALSGYEPTALLRMILRIRDSIKESEDLDQYNPFAKMDYQKRYHSLKEFIDDELKDVRGEKNMERFSKNVKY